MIKLFKFHPAFDLPDPSPFCLKAMVLLKMADLAYTPIPTNNPGRGPKGKLPAIDDDGLLIGDSEIIRWHIEKKYGFDFDRGLGPAERAQAHAFARMLEERTYWLEVHNRWIDAANWPTIRRTFFGRLPPLLRDWVPIVVRRQVRGNLRAQGVGRHGDGERAEMGRRDIRAMADHLGDKAFFMGAAPSGVDATVYAVVANCFDSPIPSPMKDEALRHPNLSAYNKRMRERFFG